jgi:hypothetical protein
MNINIPLDEDVTKMFSSSCLSGLSLLILLAASKVFFQWFLDFHSPNTFVILWHFWLLAFNYFINIIFIYILIHINTFSYHINLSSSKMSIFHVCTIVVEIESRNKYLDLESNIKFSITNFVNLHVTAVALSSSTQVINYNVTQSKDSTKEETCNYEQLP